MKRSTTIHDAAGSGEEPAEVRPAGGQDGPSERRKKRRPRVGWPLFPPLFPPMPPADKPPEGDVPLQGDPQSSDPPDTSAQGADGQAGGWIPAPDPTTLVQWMGLVDACPACLANMEVGAVPVGTVFPSGHVAPPAHEFCRCDLQIGSHPLFPQGNGWPLVP
jgi:hypothetical protein